MYIILYTVVQVQYILPASKPMKRPGETHLLQNTAKKTMDEIPRHHNHNGGQLDFQEWSTTVANMALWVNTASEAKDLKMEQALTVPFAQSRACIMVTT